MAKDNNEKSNNFFLKPFRNGCSTSLFCVGVALVALGSVNFPLLLTGVSFLLISFLDFSGYELPEDDEF